METPSLTAAAEGDGASGEECIPGLVEGLIPLKDAGHDFEDLARQWGIEITGSRDDSDLWETQLPALMAERAASLAPNQRFDAVNVDEAQDFADDWWTPLVRSLRDQERRAAFSRTATNANESSPASDARRWRRYR